MIKQGVLIKAIAGFFYISSEENIYECKAKGILRNKKIVPTVGDNVLFEVIDEISKKGNLIEILDRKNILIRPAVSNVDQVVVVMAVKDPIVNNELLDKFLVMIEKEEIDIIICLNKADLNDENIKFKNLYENAGYKVIFTSTVTNEGINELFKELENKVTVLSGPSGVGKSSIINLIQENLKCEVGEISEKLKRGKHTTRHVELFKLKNSGFILDSPGFSSIELINIDYNNLKYYYREFNDYNNLCKYNTCAHINEPNCKIKELVEENIISKERYNSYFKLYNELKNKGRK